MNKFETEICGLKELFNEKFNQNAEDHALILEQTTKTNGSVRALQQWKSFIVGGMTVITMFLIPIIIYLFVNARGEIKELQQKVYAQTVDN